MFSFRSIAHVCLFLLGSATVMAQKLEYDMFMTGKKIGTITAEKKVKGDIEMYTITSKAEATILWKDISTETTSRVVFKGGVITETYYEYKEDGVVEKYCKALPGSGVAYAVHHWKKGKYNIAEQASFCVAYLYFNEPKDGQKLFDESWGEFVTIKKTAAGEYEFKAKDGDKNVYQYSNGRISGAEFHTSIVTVKMKPHA